MIRVMVGSDSRRDGDRPGYARFIGLGFAFMLTIAVPSAVGYFLDTLFGTMPLFLLVGVVLGFAGGLYYVYRALQDLDAG